MDAFIAQLSDSVGRAATLEELTRPLLELLEAVTGLESTYLTTVDLAQGLQRVVYARNSAGPQALHIPEGIEVPWGDTLCKRALDEGRDYTDDVPGRWGDSAAAAALGIQTYVSAPLRAEDGALQGTLCAASTRQQPLTPQARQVLRLFARLIEQQLARERLVAQLQRANAELQTQALTDALTGLLNRRALRRALARLLARAPRTGRWLLVAAIDLDDFKQVNDRHGHDAGDEFLCGMAARLQAALRAGDVLARMGGDEFLVAGLGPALAADGNRPAQLLRDRLAAATVGRYTAAAAVLDYPGASVGAVALAPAQDSIEAALSAADAAMYRVKQARREAAQSVP